MAWIENVTGFPAVISTRVVGWEVICGGVATGTKVTVNKQHVRMFMLSINSWAVSYPNTRTDKPGCGCYNPLISALAVNLPLEPHGQDLDFNQVHMTEPT